MIIKLKDADFSANNIGTIIIPRELNAFTINAIELSGNSTMSDEQKQTLDMFFEDLGAFGIKSQIWSKLDKMYIPMICTELNKSCVNYISGNTDAIPDGNWLQLKHHGIARIDDAAKGSTLELDSSYVWNWSNKSAFVFNTEVITDSGKYLGIITRPTSGTVFESLYTYKDNGTGKGAISCKAQNVTGVFSSYYEADILNISLKGCSSNGESGFILFGETATEKTVNSDAVQYFNSTAKKLQICSSADGSIGNSAPPVGAAILGTYLTKAECETLGKAFNSLWAAFNM